MGNGQSREGFADVLPSASAAKVSGTTSDPPPISQAWTAESDSTTAEENNNQKPGVDSTVNTSPIVGKIVPPGHALQQEENTSRPSVEASDVVRAFNSVKCTDDDRFVIPESVRKSHTLNAYADVCSEILPGFLYVSNLRVARDAIKLRALGITHVINCCGELKHDEDGFELPASSIDSDFHVLKLLVRDDANEDLTPFLPRVMDFIAPCRWRDSSSREKTCTEDKVLVHCHQGVSRSCAFAIAYVMLEQGISYHEASAMVKRQRAISSPNAAFICQLLEWEKDLQAMKLNESTPFALGGLHRLAPHSVYDPGCLVLKRCYDPSTGSARHRQHIMTIQTPEDERRHLWSQGTFAFQNPTDPSEVIVWHGAKCVIPDALSIAEKLVRQLIRVHMLVQHSDTESIQIKLVHAREDSGDSMGTDYDHFGYATELQWTRESMPSTPVIFLPTNGTSSSDNGSIPPQLFILESIGDEDGQNTWEQLTNYDSEDLTPESSFLLCSIQPQRPIEAFVWFGTSCRFPQQNVVNAAQKQIQRLQTQKDDSALISLPIELQNQESEEFWQLFEAGY
ncbi:unnamed protein product [Phytophthora fragariaefolia]|uniref:Unnamed protein product n=1 Tax=Phytophthora fragariaefolia TaxID=1490495 RepID=A0A9W6X1U2_9STRA|nr:unnamed protein product [Phytophthora fragariaefolia]